MGGRPNATFNKSRAVTYQRILQKGLQQGQEQGRQEEAKQ
jgi:hypothetical protein